MTEGHIVTQSTSLKESIFKALQDKKAKDIVSLDLRDLDSAPADIFIICHGTSDRHAEALAKNVIEEVEKNCHELPWHKEGFENKEWILLDYVDIVVHIFQKSKRDFYGIEELWGDAVIEEIESDKE